MTISAEQFTLWLRSNRNAYTVLAEVRYGYQRSGIPAEGTIYLSNRTYITSQYDAPPNQPYLDVIDTIADYERTIDLAQLGGRGTASVGSIGLNNADGIVDFLLDDIIDGRDVLFYIGDASWPRSDFRLVNAAVVQTVRAASDTKLELTLRDKNLLLDATIIGDSIPSGPNAGKPKPILFGQIRNFDLTPYLLDTINLIYAINSYPMADFTKVIDVRDAGISLKGAFIAGNNSAITADTATDTISYTGHGFLVDSIVYVSSDSPFFAGLDLQTQYWVVADGFTANTFKLSRTRNGTPENITGATFSGTVTIYSRRWLVDIGAATIQLVSPPAGQVTADIRVAGVSGNAQFQATPHIGFQYILDTYTRLTTAERNQSSFDTLVFEEQDVNLQWGRAVLDRTNVQDVLDDIAVLTNSWYSWRSDNTLAVGKLRLADLDSVSPQEIISEDDIEGEPVCENLAIQFGKLILDADKNVVTQTNGLLAGVSAANKSLYGQEYRTRVKTTDPIGTAYPDDWWNYHKTAIESQPIASMLFTSAPDQAQVVCDERTKLFQPWTRVFKCTVGMDKYTLNPGDAVLVTYPRYGMSEGVICRVTAVKVKLADKLVDLTLIRQVIPNYLRASSFTVPDPPINVYAAAGDASALVYFEPPLADGGTDIFQYTVKSSSGVIAIGTFSPILVLGLTNGAAYTFTVIATNSKGDSLPSAPSNLVTPAVALLAPQSPVIGAAVKGNAAATIAFTPPTDDGGSPVIDYTAVATPGNISAVGTASPITVAGLTNGTAYTIAVKARNAVGFSPLSGSSNSVIPSTVPSKPSAPIATAGDSVAYVAITPPNNGGSAITGYTVAVTPAAGSDATPGGAATTHQWNGLSNGVSYKFTVTAINANGVSQTSDLSNAVTPTVGAAGLPPSSPSSVTAVALSNNSASVFFTGAGVSGVTYTVTSSGGQTANGGASPITVTGLTGPVSFTVTATNANGTSAPSASSSAINLYPAAPLSVFAVAGNNVATISFAAPNNGGAAITNYTVTSSPGGLVANGGASPITVTGLTNNVQYTFAVTATNAVGTGAPSTASNSVTPKIPAHTVSVLEINGTGYFYPFLPANTGAAATGQATVSGGVGPFTFLWAFVVDGAGIAIQGSNTNSYVNLKTTTNFAGIRTGVIRCTVVDTGNSNYTTTTDADVYLEVEFG